MTLGLDVDVVNGWPWEKVQGYIAYAEADGPWWHARGDAQAAQITAAILQCHGAKTSIGEQVLDWTPRPAKMLGWAEVERLLGG